MSLLEITITAGSTAGQRVRINRSPAPFGRDEDNALVIDLATVSRVHGELRFEENRWVVANLSPNGTVLNRKPLGKRARPLKDADQIVVGDQPVMVVALREDDDTPVVDEPQMIGAAPAEARKAGMNPRTRLWLTIAGFWVLIFTLAFIFVGLDSPEDENSSESIAVLTDRQIEDAIRSPLPKQEAIPSLAIRKFDQAESFYRMIDADPRNEFRAYFNYKEALSYAYGSNFTDSRDDWGGKPSEELNFANKRMLELETRLTDDLQRLYADAYGKLRDRRNGEAYRAFGDVMEAYANSQSPIYRNAERQRDLARRRRDAR